MGTAAGAAGATRAKPIKISAELDEHLCALRREGEGYDSMLRRHFGLASRKGEAQPLRNYYVVETEGEPVCRRTLAEARGEAILLSVKRGVRKTHKQKPEPVIRLKEIPT